MEWEKGFSDEELARALGPQVPKHMPFGTFLDIDLECLMCKTEFTSLDQMRWHLCRALVVCAVCNTLHSLGGC